MFPYEPKSTRNAMVDDGAVKVTPGRPVVTLYGIGGDIGIQTVDTKTGYK